MNTLKSGLIALAREARLYDVVERAEFLARRRRRRIRVATVVTVPVVVVATIAGLIWFRQPAYDTVTPIGPVGTGQVSALPCHALGATGAPPIPQSEGPQSTPAPVPREDCGMAIARLNMALTAALATLVPGMAITNPDGNGAVAPSFIRQVEGSYVNGYIIDLRLAIGSMSTDLSVMPYPVSIQPPALQMSMCRTNFPGNGTCTLQADGSVTTTLADTSGYQITDTRPDGTAVIVSCGPLLTLAQATAIARDPDLTLFP